MKKNAIEVQYFLLQITKCCSPSDQKLTFEMHGVMEEPRRYITTSVADKEHMRSHNFNLSSADSREMLIGTSANRRPSRYF